MFDGSPNSRGASAHPTTEIRNAATLPLGEIEISVTAFGNIDLDTARRFADLGVDRLVLLFPTKSDKELFSMTATEQDILDYVSMVGDSIVGRV